VTAQSRRDELFSEESQFDTEMAAPVLKLRIPAGTGAEFSTQECEWKQGESAVANGKE
jgi:hypothetical protein